MKTEFTLSVGARRSHEEEEPAAAPLAAPAAGLPADARAALEALSGQLGAVARGSTVAARLGGSWEEVRARCGCWVLGASVAAAAG